MADADREIAWSHSVDFENPSPGGQSIENVVGPGWEAAAFFADLIAVVAMTNQGAEAAVAEWREANAQAEEANGPDEL